MAPRIEQPPLDEPTWLLALWIEWWLDATPETDGPSQNLIERTGAYLARNAPGWLQNLHDEKTATYAMLDNAGVALREQT